MQEGQHCFLITIKCNRTAYVSFLTSIFKPLSLTNDASSCTPCCLMVFVFPAETSTYTVFALWAHSRAHFKKSVSKSKVFTRYCTFWFLKSWLELITWQLNLKGAHLLAFHIGPWCNFLFCAFTILSPLFPPLSGFSGLMIFYLYHFITLSAFTLSFLWFGQN